MVVRDIIRHRRYLFLVVFNKKSKIISKFCLITQKIASRKIIFLTQIDKEMYFEQFPPFIIIAYQKFI